MKANIKITQFSSFLLSSGYAILVKIWKWIKLLNSVPFIKKTLVNHVYIRIWSSSLTFTVSQGMNSNIKISQFSRFLLRSEYAIQVKIWKWLKLLNSVPFIKKPLVNQVYIRIWSFWLTFAVLHWMKKNSKNSQFSSFFLRFGYAILVKIWKWLKLLNSYPFVKKRLVNHVYIRIWSSWLTFTVSQGMKANIKISQFSRFLPRSEYAIQVKIWKWLKLLNSVPFIKKPLVNQVCIWIWSFWLTFTVLQWMKKNSKNSQFSSFFLRSGYAILVKIWKWLKLLNSVPFINKRLLNHVYIRIWSSWLTFTVSQGMKANIKISQFSSFLLMSGYPILVKIWKWLKLLNSYPFIKKRLVNHLYIRIWSSSLTYSVPFINKRLLNHIYIRIWSSWLTFTVSQGMKANIKISQFSSFLLRSGYVILVKIWKWLKLLNSVPFIKKRLVNDVYIPIWSSSLTFRVSRGTKANIKISQFSKFLLRSEFAIQVKIWKWLKLLNSVPFIKKPLVNQVWIWIWSCWLTFTLLQWMKKNSKNSQFSSFLLRSGYPILVKIWKWLKLLNSYPFIKKRLVNHLYIRIWSSSLTFTVSRGMKANIKISQFSRFLLSSGYAILVKIWKWIKFLNFVPFIKKTLVNHVYIRIWSSSLTFTVSQGMISNIKISQFSRFLLRSEYAIQVKIWKWLKLLNSVPFIKKPLVNQVYIRIWSFWLTFTVLHWMKKNSKNSQFSSFLLRFGYAILVKIWKWLKLLNSVPFIKKRLLNHVYIRIWSSWLTFTVSPGMKANIKISQFSRFLLRSEYPIQVKIWKWLKLLNSVPFIKKPLVNQVCILIWSFWLTFTVLQWMKKNSKNSQFSSFLLRSGYAILVKIWKWLKLLNSVPFINKRLLNHVYIRIWSSWLTFTVSQGMKANIKISQFSSFLLMSGYVILVKIWKWLKLLNSVPFIKKRLVNDVYIPIWSSSLTFRVSRGTKANIKISQFSKFLLRSEFAIQVKIWKWLKLLNSVPFIKKPLVNQVWIWIWSFWLTFTLLQWMKKNSKNSQFSSFLLRSGYPILVKIWKWLKLLNSYPFIKKRLVNHLYIRIWSSSLTFTVSRGMKANIKISQFSSFLLSSGYAILVKIWKWIKFLNFVPFIKKTLVNHVYIRIWSSSLTFTVSQGMNSNIKISQFSIFLLRSEYAIQVKIWKWLKLLNSVPIIKKPLVNQVYIRIWSFWLTFTVLHWMKKNSKNSQFSSFLLRFGYAILVKIWKWLKLLNSVPFIKKRLLNHVYIRIWSSWLTFTVSQGMKANIKISQFSRFLLRSEYPIQVKIWKWLKLLNSVPFIKKPLVNQVCILIWSFWLTFTVLQWMKKNSKNSQFQVFC